jgi:hypothetical protein
MKTVLVAAILIFMWTFFEQISSASADKPYEVVQGIGDEAFIDQVGNIMFRTGNQAFGVLIYSDRQSAEKVAKAIVGKFSGK